MYGADFDLCDDLVWNRLLSEMHEDEYDALFSSPPCSTFGCRRDDGGPPPLRGHEGSDRYGYKNLEPEDQERIRVGTLCAVRAAVAAEVFENANKPWLNEQPRRQEGRPHMYLLDDG